MENRNKQIPQAANARSALVLLGAVIFAVAAVGIYTVSQSIVDLLRAGAIVPNILATSLGLFCLFVAYRSWHVRIARSVRWLCALAALCVFDLILRAIWTVCGEIPGGRYFIPNADKSHLDAEPVKSVLELFAAITAMLIYRLAVSWFSSRLELVDDRGPEQRRLSAKFAIGTIAMLIWHTANQFVDYLRPQGAYKAGQDLLDGLSLVGPIILAVAAYKVGMFLTTRAIGTARLAAPSSS